MNKHYSVQFQRSDDAMSIGKYGLVEAYTRDCTSELYAAITGKLVPVYITSSPTHAPTKSGYVFNTKAELQTAVDLWVSDETAALKEYGDIQVWRTEKVTDMSKLFDNKQIFNEDLSSWDTSAVTTMNKMFYIAKGFNINISDWNVRGVTDMNKMFYYATAFNNNLSDWNVSATTDMRYMFKYAKEFGQVLCWDTSKADTGNMFTHTNGGSVNSKC